MKNTHDIQISVNKEKLVNPKSTSTQSSKPLEPVHEFAPVFVPRAKYGTTSLLLQLEPNQLGELALCSPIGIPKTFQLPSVHAPLPLALRPPSLLSLPPPPPRMFVACELCARIWETGWNRLMCAR